MYTWDRLSQDLLKAVVGPQAIALVPINWSPVYDILASLDVLGVCPSKPTDTTRPSSLQRYNGKSHEANQTKSPFFKMTQCSLIAMIYTADLSPLPVRNPFSSVPLAFCECTGWQIVLVAESFLLRRFKLSVSSKACVCRRPPDIAL